MAWVVEFLFDSLVDKDHRIIELEHELNRCEKSQTHIIHIFHRNSWNLKYKCWKRFSLHSNTLSHNTWGKMRIVNLHSNWLEMPMWSDTFCVLCWLATEGKIAYECGVPIWCFKLVIYFQTENSNIHIM